MEPSDKGDCEFVPGREVELSEALAIEYNELDVPALLEAPVIESSRMSYLLANWDALDAARWPRGLEAG
jgi:hypothetical protein